MRLKLLPFQLEAGARVVNTITSRMKAYDATRHDENPMSAAFALTSVTGSGKTVIAASVIEALLKGSTDYASEPIEGLTVLWVSYDPSLCVQTKSVFAQYADAIHPTRLKVIESESFNEDRLMPGHVYFLSLPLLGSNNRLTRSTDVRTNTFWDVLDATVRRDDTNLLVVVDEAHVGMNSRGGSANSKSLLESVIAGHDAYQGAPVVWGISATPERFHRKIKQLLPASSGGDIVVSPRDVQASGLLKKSVDLYTPAESASMHLTMLDQGIEELKASTREWRRYRVGAGMGGGDVVVPLMVAQLANRAEGGSLAKEDEMIASIVKAARAKLPGFSSKNIAHVIADRGTITVGDVVIEKIDPVAVQDRDDVQILIAKDAVSTGWDCPRAEVLVSMRSFSDTTAIAQMLGRMVRTPLARATDVERLDRVSCWVPFFTIDTVQHVVDVLTGEVDLDTGEDKVSIEVAVNPQRFNLGGHVEEDDDDDDDDIDINVVDEMVADLGQDVSMHHVVERDVRDDDGDHDVTPTQVSLAVAVVDDGKSTEHASAVTAVPVAAPVAPKTKASMPTHIAEAIEAITALPSYSLPSTKVSPIKRLLEVASLLAQHGGEQDVTAGRDVLATMVRHLEAQRIVHVDAYAKAREELVTSEQQITTATFDGTKRVRLSITVPGGMDMIQYEFDVANRALVGLVKAYYEGKFKELYASGVDPNEFELKADAAALGCVPQIVEAVTTSATQLADELLAARADSFVTMAPSVQARLEQLRLASRQPQVKEFVLGTTKTYTSRTKVSGAAGITRLPKHVYSDRDGMWPVPSTIEKNTWEMAVLAREVDRDETIAWYRNPSANAKDSLSIPYLSEVDVWRTFQPDFLFVERTHGGLKVAIVDPHWLADQHGLVRMQAFASYVGENEHLISRANPVAQLPGSKNLVRLSLQRRDVRDAVMRANSVVGVFSSHGEPYPVS